jgi:hypothetical protein
VFCFFFLFFIFLFLNFCYDFFFKYIFVDFIFWNWDCWEFSFVIYFFLFILSLYKINVVYGFTKVTQIAPIYEFGGLSFFFLNWTWFFYSLLFFSHIVKNIVLEKSHVIKNYKVTIIKWCEETILHPHTLHCQW